MSNTRSCNIALADDHNLIRRSLRSLLETQGYHIVIDASDGSELIEKILTSGQPDICIVDMNMSGMDGITTTLYLKKRWPSIKVLIFSMNDHHWYRNKALSIGADAYISKDESIDELLRTVKELCARAR